MKQKNESLKGLRAENDLLRHQNRNLRDYIDRNLKTIHSLQERLTTADAGLAELNRSVDALLAVAALKYGSPAVVQVVPAAAFKLPVADVSNALDKYDVTTTRSGDDYLIEVKQKEAADVSQKQQ